MSIDYSGLLQSKGPAYRDSQIKSHSKYKVPIDTSNGRFAGNSRIHGDASQEVQQKTIDSLIYASHEAGLNTRQTAWYEFRKLADLKQIEQNIAYQTEYYKKVEHATEIKNAINKLSITSCGGQPCLKLDTQSERWGKEGEYILIQSD